MPVDFKITPVYVTSHRRSGTHLTLDNLSNNFSQFAGGFSNFDVGNPSGESSQLFKTHFNATGAVKKFDDHGRVIYVIRDGRDVMVSLYHYEKAHVQSVANLSFAEFLHTVNPYDTESYGGEMNRIEYWAYHVNSWVEEKKFDKLIVSFDQWRTDFDDTIAKVASFLELDPNSTLKTMARTRPESLASKLMRKIGLSKRTSVLFRGGRSGDWKQHFDHKSLDLFKSITKSTYDKLPSILDFEESL
jgi:hypothetical protein